MTGFASLIKGLDPEQDPPPELLAWLGSTLRSRMEQFDLWEKPPGVLGYGRFRSWSEPQAFAVLLGDCFEACIRKRLSQLQRCPETNGELERNIGVRVDGFLVNYTVFVRQLELGVEPSRDVVEGLCQLLKRDVRRQLKISNFWHQSPAKLGVLACRDAWRDDEAVTELMHEAYMRSFTGSQIGWLKDQIALGHNIDGRVRLEIQRMINERWRKYSRHEYKLFKNLEAVVQAMEIAGQLYVTPEIRKKTVREHEEKARVVLKPAFVVAFAANINEEQLASADALREALRSNLHWLNDVEQLVGGKKAQRIIEAGIQRFQQFGITCFLFGELYGVLRAEYEREVGIPQFEEVADGISCETELATGEVLWDTAAAHREIDRSSYQAKVKQRLHEIETVQYLAVETGMMPPGPTELATMLGIPKQTASDYVKRLQDIRRRI